MRTNRALERQPCMKINDIPIRLVDLKHYRQSEGELQRTADVERLLSQVSGGVAIDVGARDGHFSKVLTRYFDSVVALDLEKPQVQHPRVRGVAGDVTCLDLPTGAFDLVLCTEVLEHIDPKALTSACSELARVSRGHLLIGVPFKQDIRIGRTTCTGCGTVNPPWGHVNTFDEPRLLSLFPTMNLVEVSYVGVEASSTNELSAYLMNLAGNPYGTYGQDEPCIGCGAAISEAPSRSLLQKACTKAAHLARRVTEPLAPRHPKWIHCLFGVKGPG